MSATPLQRDLVDTREMKVVHSFFRRELRLAAGLVRRVPTGDTARAARIHDHLDLVARCLHEHHTVEDDLLWPLLLERLPEELAPIVTLMEAQHQRLDSLLGRITVLQPAWRDHADRETAEELASTYDELYVALAEHLDDEEERLLPLAARSLSQQEWDAMGARARSEQRRSEATLILGMLQHDGDPEVFASMLASAPPPVRWLLPRLARRAFRKHALAVHGSATP